MWDTILAVAGTAMDIWGNVQQGQAQKEANQGNAALMQKEADYQAWLGEQKVVDLGIYKNRLAATQKVRFAKAGIQLDSATAIAVGADTEMQYEKDLAYLRTNTQFQVERALAGATSFNEQAKSVQTVSNIQTARTLLNFADTARRTW